MRTQDILKACTVTGLAITAAGRRAEAHVCNVVLSNPAVTTTCGDPDDPDNVGTFTPTVARDGTISFTDDAFSPYGWRAGTLPTLGDSHVVDDGKFYLFTLHRRSVVTIKLANAASNPSPFDPAFTVYQGRLPDEAHDDAAFDPLNPVDDVSFLPVASPTDTAPAGHVYRPVDQFRDTLRYTQTGGLDDTGNPVHPFTGQFNAINDFSLANEAAVPGQPAGDNWSVVRHVAHENCRGPGATESLTLVLPAGTYTIAAGGANCTGPDAGTACGASSFYTATLSLKVYGP